MNALPGKVDAPAMAMSPEKLMSPEAPMSPETLRALAELHDLQVYELGAYGLGVFARWPLTLTALALILSGLAGLVVLHWRRRPKQVAGRRLSAIESRYRDRVSRSPDPSRSDAIAALAALGELLRDVAGRPVKPGRLSFLPLRPVRPAMPPGLAGEAFLDWLDQHAPSADRGGFAGSAGQLLLGWPFARPDAAAPERPEPAAVDTLFALAARWLRANA
jgi:hypothetical protein